MSGERYAARPEAMRSAVGNVGGIIMRARRVLVDFERLTNDMDPASFGSIGSAVGSASAPLRGLELSALRSLLLLLQSVSARVDQSADKYQAADRAVALSYGGKPVPTSAGPQIWSSPAGAAVAGYAARDAAGGGVPTPHRAESVIGYLAGADLGQLGRGCEGAPLCVPVASAGQLAAWLADSPTHQAQLGVIAVYAGAAGGFDDTPGGLHPGDLVSVEPGVDAADRQVTVGVVGDHGVLYNHGRLSVDFGGIAQVQVYRPLRAGSAYAWAGVWPGVGKDR
jgi:hypothetical protein